MARAARVSREDGPTGAAVAPASGAGTQPLIGQAIVQFGAGDVLTLRDAEDVESMIALGTFDVIFHQASITGVVGAHGEDLGSQHRMMRNNAECFRRLLDWAVQTKARVIWASSCSVYGRGGVPMKESGSN